MLILTGGVHGEIKYACTEAHAASSDDVVKTIVYRPAEV